jgi:hypothetical protein
MPPKENTSPSDQDIKPLIDKLEFPLPPAALKQGVRLKIDFKDNKVRMRVEALARWT